jgi:heat shock protein HslJ
MRALPALLLMVFPAMSQTEGLIGRDWHLVAIDGRPFTAGATLRIEAGGAMSGKAPCNRWSAANRAELPKLSLGAIRSTRMACDRMLEEGAFFAALATMTDARLDRDDRLILTGPNGRTTEFTSLGAIPG